MAHRRTKPLVLGPRCNIHTFYTGWSCYRS
ncbi:hypothetical protein LINGRAHAP2_LOCUS20397 [Linum grandiflorum]